MPQELSAHFDRYRRIVYVGDRVRILDTGIQSALHIGEFARAISACTADAAIRCPSILSIGASYLVVRLDSQARLDLKPSEIDDFDWIIATHDVEIVPSCLLARGERQNASRAASL